MADQEMRFDAVLVDAISAPLNAIAENLQKVADQMQVMTQKLSEGFDSSTKATEALDTTMQGLGTKVAETGQKVADLGDTIETNLVPSLDKVAGTNDAVKQSLDTTTQALAGNTTALKDNTDELETNSIVGMEVEGKLKDLSATLTTVETDFETSAGIIGGAMNSALQNVARSVTDLNANIPPLTANVDANTQALDTNTTAVNTNMSAATGLRSAVQNLDVDISTGLTPGVDAATQAIDKNTIATDTNSTAMRGLKTSTAGAAAGMKSVDDAGKAGEEERKTGYGSILGATMLLGFAGSAVRAGADIVKMGMDGETALNKVLALADTDQSHFQQYKDTVVAWAGQFGQSVQSLAGGLYDVTSVGFTPATGALNILKYAAEAAAAGGSDLHTVTAGLTSIMKAYAMSGTDAEKATDILITGVRLGKSTFEEYSGAIGLVGVVSREANLKITDSAAALSTLTQVWHSARQAGQNLQNMIQAVGLNTDSLAKRAEKAGISFNEQKYASMDLRDKLNYLWQISDKNAQTFRTIIGNSTATKAAYWLVADGANYYKSTLDAMQNSLGTTDQAFATHQETMQAHIDDLKGSLSGLAMTITSLAAPAINAALEALTQALNGAMTFLEQHSNVLIPILIVLAGIIGGLLVGALVALGHATRGMVMEALEVAAPITIAVGVLTLLGMALKHAYDHSEPFREAVNELWTAAKQLGAVIGQAVNPILGMLVGVLKDLGTWFDGLFGHMEPVKRNFDDVATSADGVFKHGRDMAGALQNMGDKLVYVRGPLSPVIDFIHKLAGDVSTLTGYIKDLSDKLLPHAHMVETTSVHYEKIHGHMVKVVDTVSHLEPGVNGLAIAFHHGWDAVKKVADALGNLIGPLAAIGAGIATTLVLHKNWLDICWRVAMLLIRFSGIIGELGGFFGAFGGQMTIIITTFKAWNSVGGIFTGLSGVIRGVFVPALGEMAAGAWAAISPLLPFIAIGAAVAIAILAMVVAFRHFWDTNAGFRQFIGNFLGQLKELGTWLLGQFKVIWDNLVQVFKDNVLPAWKQLQDAFQEAQPFLIAIGAIIGGLLIANIGLLIGWIKGLVALLVGVLSGAFRMVGGVIEVIAGIIKVFAAILGGVIQIVMDAIHGNWQKAWEDCKKMVENVVSGIGSILHGLWSIIAGFFQGTIGAILSGIGNFVGGVIGFFQHLFDKLVGHSIVPDLINSVIAWFLGLPPQVLKLVENLILGVLGFFLQLPLKVMLTLADLEVKAVGFFLGLAKHILDAMKNIPILGFFANIASGAISQMQGMVKGVGGLLDNLVNDTKNKEQQAKVQAGIQQEQAKINAISTKEVEVRQVLASEEQKKLELIKKAQETHDPIKRAQLEHEIAMISSQQREQVGMLDQMERQKVEAIKKKAQEKAELERLQEEAKKNILQKIADMVGQGLDHLAQMALGAIKHIQDFISNIIGGIVGGIAGVANAITQVVNNITGAITGLISNAISLGGQIISNLAKGITQGIPNAIGGAMGGLGNFIKDHIPHSPAKLGPMRDIMEWGPSITKSLGVGIAAGTTHLSDPLAKVGQTIKDGVLNAAGVGTTGGATAIPGRGLLGPGGDNDRKLEIHLHLDGGLGAGLQLLQPSDRKRLIRQIAEEFAAQTRLQGRVGIGYSGR